MHQTGSNRQTAVKWPLGEPNAIHCSQPTLSCLNFNIEFILQTNTSEQKIGAVLSQPEYDAKEHRLA